MRRLLQAVVLLLALVAPSCGGAGSRLEEATPGRIVDLTSIEPLRQAFNDDEGRARVLLLLSPT
jgi:hypothetical protein